MSEFSYPPQPDVTVTGSVSVDLGENDRQLCVKAEDVVSTFVYLDSGTDDERVSTITYFSAALGLTAVQTFSYAGSSGSYRVDDISWS